MQVWFYKGEILINSSGRNKTDLIKQMGYPIIIHAVIDLAEFKEEVSLVLGILNELDLKELIIHPICKIKPIEKQSIYKLQDAINSASNLLIKNDIKLYIENNCKISPIHYSADDVKIIFDNNDDIELLIDIAHIDSYEHLKELKNIKYPKMLHLADKHCDIDHEHLPIGEGDLNFTMIFEDIFEDFEGKIILEIDQDDEAITESTRKIKEILGRERIKYTMY
jgi:sugar phosphate isomerase/epimerase